MKLLKYYILLFFVNLCFANTVTDPVVSTAIDQLNYLNAANSNNTGNNNWYIYFLNKDLDYLKKVLASTNDPYENIHIDNLSIDIDYLNKLNEQLVELNKSEHVDVYVAFTGADNKITIPIIPKGKTKLEQKINYIDSLVLFGVKSTKEREQLLESKVDLEKYNTYLQKKLAEIYEGSNLVKNSTASNIIMPFSNRSLRYVYNENGETKEKYSWAYSLYLGKTERRFNYKTYRDFFNKEASEKAFGPTNHYKRVSKQVIALAKYFNSDVPLLEDYKEDCTALLNDPRYAPLLESRILRSTLINNPCILKGMVPMGPFDTSKSQWMKDTELMIVAPLYFALLAPVATEAMIPVLVESIGVERSLNVSVAMTVSVMMESALLYYWTGNQLQKENFGEAVKGINKTNVFYEGVKALVDIPLPVELISDCAYNGAQLDKLLNNPTDYNFEWHTSKCFIGATLSVFARYGVNQTGALFKTLTKLAKENPKIFIIGWKRILHDVKVDQITDFKKLNNVLKEQFVDVGFTKEKVTLFKDFITGKKPIEALDDALKKLDNIDGDINTNTDVTTSNDTTTTTDADSSSSADNTNASDDGNTNTASAGGTVSKVTLVLNDIRISQTGLIKKADGSFKIQFNSKKDITSLKDFLETTTKGRKGFIENLQNNPQAKATLKTDLPDTPKGSEIEITEIEISTTLADGSVKNSNFKIEEVNNVGGKLDELFPAIKDHPDFQGFKNLCTNNPKVSVKLAGDEWMKFTSEIKTKYVIRADRNLAKMEFEGQEFLIASGKKFNNQMINSGKFLPKEFVDNVNKGQRVFTPSISTRHLDTESLGLEYFAKLKNAVQGGKYPKVTGKVKITSDLCPCPSCSAIFHQFSDMFPNVTIDITTTTKLHY